ncbi:MULTISPECIES: hypothetical protein [Bradyrhizobium]|uniref:hypothetical protein n=1 Tax=Bradyrhizobium TaxID=374 RepID=UPI001B8A6590|nr:MULTISPECIES: hypothetical protein [Bradyrhizobium]MBR0969287.1 hypothetical protein [Bradyrhizobium japonicum]
MARPKLLVLGVWVSLSKPSIELESTDRPLAVEQRNRMSVDRVAEIYAYYVHGQGRA